MQFRSTDWDFLLARAEANGKLVFTNDDQVKVKTPVLSGPPVCTLQFGATVMELDAEMDARWQYDAVKSFTWDASQQAVVTKDAADPGIAGAGNLSGATSPRSSGSTISRWATPRLRSPRRRPGPTRSG